jgi:hypothetical protein
VRQNMVNYTLKTIELCNELHMYLFPSVLGTLWHSLVPFWIFSGVGLVQCIITRRSGAEIQLNWKKYQTNSGKSQTWWLLHNRHLEAWEKVWEQYNTWSLSSNRAYTPGFLGFMGSKYRIGLKLFLKLPNAFCEATTKFEIFWNSFGTFFSLFEFPHDFTK